MHLSLSLVLPPDLARRLNLALIRFDFYLKRLASKRQRALLWINSVKLSASHFAVAIVTNAQVPVAPPIPLIFAKADMYFYSFAHLRRSNTSARKKQMFSLFGHTLGIMEEIGRADAWPARLLKSLFVALFGRLAFWSRLFKHSSDG